MYNQDDDLKYAIDNNGIPTNATFAEKDIEEIMAEVPGENDELSWYWIVRLVNGRFALLEGRCDYSGWDCQSELNLIAEGSTALGLAELAPEQEVYSKRTIRKNLTNQLLGKQPKFLYQE